ncbi:hypothetical protein F2Q68_00024880 [Brassica cretica]|uniref:Uncharacterized protein n=1 Tax=Brassica cretica TaxID=69181 RepID=A0A8S9IIH2_BRACR|nr:hypothetical protein F2Q68_00024880 [Brassica cretica]
MLEDALHRSNLFIELEEEKEAMAKKYAITRMVATKEKPKEESQTTEISLEQMVPSRRFNKTVKEPGPTITEGMTAAERRQKESRSARSESEAEARLAWVDDRISRIELCSYTCLGPTLQGINRAESCPPPKEETLSVNGLKNPDPTAKPRPDSHGSAIG